MEEETLKPKPITLTQKLESMSIDDLEQFIKESQDQIVQAQQMIAKKRAANLAAASFFKS